MWPVLSLTAFYDERDQFIGLGFVTADRHMGVWEDAPRAAALAVLNAQYQADLEEKQGLESAWEEILDDIKRQVGGRW